MIGNTKITEQILHKAFSQNFWNFFYWQKKMFCTETEMKKKIIWIPLLNCLFEMKASNSNKKHHNTKMEVIIIIKLHIWEPTGSSSIRCRKSSTIRGKPSLREILGSQNKRFLALVMSGFLLWGSSAVFSLNSITAWVSITSLTTLNMRGHKLSNSFCSYLQ